MFYSGCQRASRSLSRELRGIHSNAVLRQAAPALAAKKSGGLLSLIFGGGGTKVPPMYDPLPGLVLPPPLEDVPPVETKITTLPNGFKIASEATPGATSTVGIYINSGTIYETPETLGISHLLERMAFKSTRNRTHFNVVRSVEAIGAVVQASASREQMGYTADGLKTYYPELVELVADTVRNSSYHPWEVKDQLVKMKGELDAIGSNPQHVVLEALHAAGYAGALARPLLAPDVNLGRLSGDLALEFVKENYTAPRMVLAASGVDHADLVAVAEPLFGDLPKVGVKPAPKTVYAGGDWRGAAAPKHTHVAVAFEVAGGWMNEKDAITLTVLQTFLGGGGSFSAGGPGKGMHSKLYREVLAQHEKVESCTAFSTIYNNTGLFGIHSTANGPDIPYVVDLMTQQLQSVTSAAKIGQVQLDRAKNALISAIYMNLEQRVVVTEDIGRQILTYGLRKSPFETISQIQALTAADVAAVASKVLKTPLTMVTYGDVVHAPRYDQVAQRFG